MALRQLPDFASRPPSARPLRFVYFAAAAEQAEHAAYHAQLVIAEMLLHRLMYARARGMAPVREHLREETLRRSLRRPSARRCIDQPAEAVRWFDRNGQRRARPLTREQLTQALMERGGMPLLRAVAAAATQSHALSDADQAWLDTRASLPAWQRPLLGCEYERLVGAIEAAHAVPAPSPAPCAANVAVALRAAALLGSRTADYTPSPFRVPALARAYLAAQHDRLCRRAAFAGATELRLRFSHARPRIKMDAKLASQRAEHAAWQAGRALGGICCGGMAGAWRSRRASRV